MARSPFVWGDNGEQLTPERVEALRAAAIAAQRQAQGRPIKNVWEGLASLTDAWGGYKGNLRADREETEGRAGAKSVIDALLGGGNVSMSSSGAPASAGDFPVVSGGVGFAGQTPSAPAGDLATRLRMKMIDGGLPEHVADGFLMNFQSESGMNPGINEQAPTVPGSRGGYGLYQLTGPRRRAYEAFAAQRGVDVADPDAQIEFMLGELQGPESRAAQSIMAAPDAGTAAAAIARDFLRPAPEHLQRRVAEYTGGQGVSASSMGGGAQQGTSPVMQALLQASSDPWVAQEYGPVLQALMGQEQSRQQFAMEQADPMRQLEMQKAQLEIEQMQNPTREPIEVGGVLLDPVTYQPIFDSRTQEAPTRLITGQEAIDMGLPAGAYNMGADGKVTAIGGGGTTINNQTAPPAGYRNVFNEAGQIVSQEPIPGGPADQKLREAQAAQEATSTKGMSNAMTATDVVTSSAARAREANNQRVLGGPLGTLASNLPNTANAEVYRQVDVLKANAKIENLTAMRAASPTGGALGSVTEGESAMLAAKSGALDPASPNFTRDLDDYERTLLRVVHGRQEGDAIFEATRDTQRDDAPERGGLLGGDQRAPAAPSVNGATIAPAAILSMTEQELMMLPVDQLDEAGLDAMEARFQQLEEGQ